MRVRILFFASLKDIVGARELRIDLPPDASVASLWTVLEETYPGLSPYHRIVLAALNEEYVSREAKLTDGDEVAFFPPVSGGEPFLVRRKDEFYEITREPIDVRTLSRQLLRAEDGAICIFEGVVRNNSKGKTTRYLEYEGYESMALKTLGEIGVFVRGAWEVGAIAIVHRLGRMEIGETSVAVIITSPHRRAAFDACHYAIDKLKKVVPIWKKEFFEDGEVWIEGN